MALPEPYRVTFTSRARRDLAGLAPDVAFALFEHISGSIATSPHRVGGPLRGRWSGCLAARRGGHRVIYRVDEDAHEIRIEHIGPRGDVYRP